MVPYSGALVPLSAVQRGNIDHRNGAIYSKQNFLQQPLEVAREPLQQHLELPLTGLGEAIYNRQRRHFQEH
jgi:hypothetical protein